MAPSHSCLHGLEVSKTAEGQQSGVVQAAMLLIVACTWFLRVSRLREMWNLEMKFQETLSKTGNKNPGETISHKQENSTKVCAHKHMQKFHKRCQRHLMMPMIDGTIKP
jgi:ABC-type nickel/cobalt efflux system permease component RcnA